MPTRTNPYLAGFVVYLALGILGAHWGWAGAIGLSMIVIGRIHFAIAEKRAERLFAHQAIAARADYEFDNPDPWVRTYGQHQPYVRSDLFGPYESPEVFR